VIDDPTGLWKVCRFDLRTIPDPLRRRVLEWVAGLDVDVLTVTPWLAVSQESPDGRLRAHLSRFVYEDGEKVIDHAMERMHSEPAVIPIAALPDWLPAYQQHLVETGGQ
jgi:hypothetical protein